MTSLQDRSNSLHPPLDVDERVKLYDEAAYGLAAELATHLPDRYMVVENHSDGLGAVDPATASSSGPAGPSARRAS